MRKVITLLLVLATAVAVVGQAIAIPELKGKKVELTI